jgi:glycosyltransferase involved in cell wall biosynthesis
MDVVYSNLSIRNVLYGKITPRTEIESDPSGNLDAIRTGVFWPRNSHFGFHRWIHSFSSLVTAFIRKHGTPDIIHAHTYLGAAVVASTPAISELPLVTTVHYSGILNNSIPLVHRSWLTKGLAGSDMVVAVSTSVKKALIHQYDIPSVVIPNFVDDRLFVPKRHQGKDFVFVFVGDLIPRKNVESLLQAFLLLKEQGNIHVSLQIIGEGPEKENLISFVQLSGLLEDVEFLGQLTQLEVAQALQRAHALVLPSYHETFGIVLVEAFMCGIPVISTPSGGPLDIISPQTGIIASDMTVPSIRSAMYKLISNYSSFDSRKIRSYALDRFSVSAIGPQLLEAYKSVIANN